MMDRYYIYVCPVSRDRGNGCNSLHLYKQLLQKQKQSNIDIGSK